MMLLIVLDGGEREKRVTSRNSSTTEDGDGGR